LESLVFPSSYRLKKRREFNNAWNLGKKYHTNHFIIIILENKIGPTRLGITASRKVGGAVQRNRVKRLLREVFRINYPVIKHCVDFSIIAKKGSHSLGYEEVQSEIKHLLTG
jgi:ribonuclease P protein component